MSDNWQQWVKELGFWSEPGFSKIKQRAGESRELEDTVNKEFISAINQVCRERQLSREIVIEAIEAALISAYKRNFGAAQTITAKIDPETGAAQVFVEKELVPEVLDDQAQIALDEARAYASEADIGDVRMLAPLSARPGPTVSPPC